MIARLRRHQLLVEWNNTEAEYPHIDASTNYSESRRSGPPNGSALISERDQVSYRDSTGEPINLETISYKGLDGAGGGGRVMLERSVDDGGFAGSAQGGGATCPWTRNLRSERWGICSKMRGRASC